MTSKYKVYAEILLDVEEVKATVIPNTLSQRSQLLDLTNKINVEKAIILSPVVLKSLAEKYPDLKKRLYKDLYAPRQELQDKIMAHLPFPGDEAAKSLEKKVDECIRFLQKKLDVTQLPNSNIIRVSILAGDPVFGERVMGDLLKLYLTHRTRVEKFPNAPGFFDEQINRTRRRIREMEDALSGFQEKEKIIDYDREAIRLTKEMEFFDQALATVRKDVITLENNLADINANLRRDDLAVMPSEEFAANPLLLKLYDKMIELKLEIIDLKQMYKDQDPQVVASVQELRMVKAELLKEVKKIVALMTSTLARYKAEERAIAEVVETLRNNAAQLPLKGQFMSRLQRNISSEAATLTNLVQRRNQELVARASDNRLENIKLITPPTYTRKKETPRRALNILISIIVGLILGLGVAMLKEYLDESVSNEEELRARTQHLDLPLLGAIMEKSK
ncbi:MAG: hypothetical protein GY859_06245 [Desulfobacterales bacterium]|nr:hypothetical protein [Desulfobacterales bacterium]